jgi:hypothetical protein
MQRALGYQLITVVFCCAVLWSNHSVAEGALAVGVPADIARQGFAYAYTNNKTSPKEARTVALTLCSSPGPNKSAQARALCKLVSNYKNQCVAVAEDPLAGTPGVGWSIADNLRAAAAQALAKCEATAGPGRRAACRVDHSLATGLPNKLIAAQIDSHRHDRLGSNATHSQKQGDFRLAPNRRHIAASH